MEPITICLISLAAIALWLVFLALRGAESLFLATFESVLWAACGLIGYGFLHLFFNFVIILFTDFSVLGDIIEESFGGIGGLILVIVLLVVIGAIIWFFGSIILGVLLWLVGFIWEFILSRLLDMLLKIYVFLEETAKDLFELMVNKLYEHIAKS